MAKISELIKSQFDPSSRGKGLGYYLTGAVSISRIIDDGYMVVVRGTQSYTVTAALDKNIYTVSCNCPFYSPENTPCKHIWAAQLQLESAARFSSYAGAPVVLKTVASGTPLPASNSKKNATRYNDPDDYEDYSEEDILKQVAEMSRHFGRDIRKDIRFGSQVQPRNDVHKEPVRTNWETLFSGTAHAQEEKTTKKQVNGEILYVLDPKSTVHTNTLRIELMVSRKSADGSVRRPVRASLSPDDIATIENLDDREILYQLFGMNNLSPYTYRSASSEATVSIKLQQVLIPELIRTGRFFLRTTYDDMVGPITMADPQPWELRLRLNPSDDSGDYYFDGALHRNEVSRDFSECLLVTMGGFVFFKDLSVAPLNDFGCFQIMSEFRTRGAVHVPAQQAEKFMESYLNLVQRAPIDVPPQLRFEQIMGTPVPLMRIRKADARHEKGEIVGEVFFKYDERMLAADSKSGAMVFKEQKRVILRDLQTENSSKSFLDAQGFTLARRAYYSYSPGNALQFPKKQFHRTVSTLLDAGWVVEGEGALYKKAGAVSISVTSGIDWFDLTASCEFDGAAVALPQLLSALKKGEGFIRLDDGTMGMLPQEWLGKYGHIVKLGHVEGDAIRFKNSQALMIDMLLADQPEACCDATFKKIRDELGGFSGIEPVQPPEGFGGTLRPYQAEGLGWLLFLQKFGIGGCLADDMGLGKTVQVLALLALRAQALSTKKGSKKPILIVVPRSLIFNWQREAAQFTPQLRFCDFSHSARKEAADSLLSSDVILVTYGTLRRDIATLKDVSFDYAILDEAQAIKNATSLTAKAVRLINADHRLVLSGTPIENHLGELWGLFEFLNPGILGSSSVFKGAEAALKRPDDQTVEILRKGLRPFILRRTKAQVATDLPKKLEETLICEMKPAQQRLYDELKEHYRESLLGRVKKEGMNKSKIQILEALLRLRQAACHPGLIDKKRVSEGSAKLDTLLAQIDEVVQEGHKALIFSQFTSMLSIVKSRLDKSGMVYEYLDGKTKNRQERVDRFQNDTACSLFLISLKAGGVGLNLTAAEYVFLLDPWWNPAVEAQAIDRTHRIGQVNPVFAYRLICKGTVEEKVLELQKTKRALAESIITADNSLIRSMKAEDLELLLA